MLFLSLVILQIVIFAALVLFLRVILARNISSATTHLNELNQGFTQKEDEAKKKLKEADQYFEQTVLKAREEAEQTKSQLLKEAYETQDNILKQARAQSEEILRQANEARDSLLKEMDKKVEERSFEKAGGMLQEILPQELGKDMHLRWVEELSKHGLEELERLNLPQDLREAQVVSAYPLSADQKDRLHKKIKDKLRREVKLSEKVDPRLIAGLKMTLGSVEIDGSLKFKLKEMIRDAKRSNQA